MSIQSPAEVAKAADMLKKQSLKLTEEAKKTMTEYKKYCGEFETIRGGLLEGADIINKQVKELTTSFMTFDKMSTKLELIRKDLIETGKRLRAIIKPVSEVGPDSAELIKQINTLLPINKGNALLATSKSSLEIMTKSLQDLKENMGVAADDCEGLPGAVPRPKGV